MSTIRRLALLALALGFIQAIFGAIVRITGSGLGCGDHWPKCIGSWLPELGSRETVIELSHRGIALALSLATLALAIAVWRRRAEPAISGPGGVLTPAATALGLVVVTALFGMVTVKLTLTTWTVAVHMVLAMSLLAALVVATTRSGALGGASARGAAATDRTRRSTRVAIGLAFVVLVFGSLTANVPGAGPACQGFPLCSGGLPSTGLQGIQFTHRVLAVLLALHVVGLTVGVVRRGDPAPVRRATMFAMGAILAQIVVAAALVEMRLPPALRSVHQGTGFLVWLSILTLASLVDLGSRSPAPQTSGARDPIVPRGARHAGSPA